MARQIEELKEEKIIQDGIIKDFITEKIQREQQDQFYKEYFKQRVRAQDQNKCIKDQQLSEAVYHLSESVRDLTISFQEDTSFFDSSMSTLLRQLDTTLKTLQPPHGISSSFDYGGSVKTQHFMISQPKSGTSRNQGSGPSQPGGSSSFTKKTMISTIEGRDSSTVNNENQ